MSIRLYFWTAGPEKIPFPHPHANGLIVHDWTAPDRWLPRESRGCYAVAVRIWWWPQKCPAPPSRGLIEFWSYLCGLKKSMEVHGLGLGLNGVPIEGPKPRECQQPDIGWSRADQQSRQGKCPTSWITDCLEESLMSIFLWLPCQMSPSAPFISFPLPRVFKLSLRSIYELKFNFLHFDADIQAMQTDAKHKL